MSRHHLALLLFITLCRLSLTHARLVDDADGDIVYSSSASLNWRRTIACKLHAAKCLDGWWAEHSSLFQNGSLHVTSGPVASASFTFRGTAIHLVGSTFPRGARALVAVDDHPAQSVDFASATASRVDGVRLFTLSGLNPTTEHTIRVSYDAACSTSRQHEPRVIALDAFIVEESTDGPTILNTHYPVTPTISSPSGTVLARADDIPTALSGLSPNAHDLYAVSDETTTSPTVTNWTRDPGDGLQTGQIAAISIVCGVLFSAFICSVIWCIRMRILSSPRRVLPSSRQGESVLSWSFGSVSRHRNGSTQMRERPRTAQPRLPGASIRTAATVAPGLTTNVARASLEAQRSPSPIQDLDILTPTTPGSTSPISPANSLTPLTMPRRAASTTASTRRAAPPPLPLSASQGIHPHAVPISMSSPRFFEHSQVVVIPPSPAPTVTAPPPYTPRSRGRSPRTLQELREKMSPYTP